MKTTLSILFLLTASLPAFAQYHHGHGGYSHTSSSYTPSYTPPRTPATPRTTQATRPQTQTNRPTPAPAPRPEPTPSQIARQRAEAAETPQLQQVRQEAMDALERIAAESRRMNGQGYDCIIQQTGGMDCYRQPNINAPVSYQGQEVLRNPGVYTGAGEGRNNPSIESVRNTGPIPQGTWNVSQVAQTLQGRPHANVLHLEPATDTETYGRDSFRMHGDYATTDPRHGTASSGCPIVPRETRSALTNMLNQGGAVRLEVRPGAPASSPTIVAPR